MKSEGSPTCNGAEAKAAKAVLAERGICVVAIPRRKSTMTAAQGGDAEVDLLVTLTIGPQPLAQDQSGMQIVWWGAILWGLVDFVPGLVSWLKGRTLILAGLLLAACAGPSPARVSASDGMAQVYVPAGEFLMGSAASDPAAYAGESPLHRVYLKDFWIDRTEVTTAMYARCVEAGACQPPAQTTSYTRNAYYGSPEFADYPVIFVTWTDALAYCQWVGGQLPTEAEWEKAARGTDGRPYPWGAAAPDRNLLNFNVQVGDTTEVGRYPAGASPYGALDMLGNVWEWVADWYEPDYYAQSPQRDPLGPDHGLGRVMKGGSWNVTAQTARVAVRGRRTPDYAYDNVGFRCVR